MPDQFYLGRFLKGMYLLCLFTCPSSGKAQQFLAGRVHKKNSPDVLLAVTVENLVLQKYDQSDMGGNFRIPASPGDRVAFSIAGYRPDTVLVTESMLTDRYEVYLVPNVVQLTTVKVGDLNSYQVDSLQRLQDYESFYNDHTSTSILSHSTPESGFGVTFSPISFFSQKERHKRQLRKRLASDEKEFYISYRFSRTYIWRLTRLGEDSLTLFIARYRPTYKFCRAANDQDMLNYVNARFKEFMKRP